MKILTDSLSFIKKILIVFSFLCLESLCFVDFVFDLNLQPYKNAEFFADGNRVEAKLISSDKTLGRLNFRLKDSVSHLVIQNEGFRTYNLNLASIKNKKSLCYPFACRVQI